MFQVKVNKTLYCEVLHLIDIIAYRFKRTSRHNILVIFIAYPVTATLSQFLGISLGMWTAYFFIINAASHVIITKTENIILVLS